MGWIVSLFFLIFYFVSKDFGAAIACGLFGLAGAMEMVSNSIDKFVNAQEKAQMFGNIFSEYLKSLADKNNEERS